MQGDKGSLPALGQIMQPRRGKLFARSALAYQENRPVDPRYPGYPFLKGQKCL